MKISKKISVILVLAVVFVFATTAVTFAKKSKKPKKVEVVNTEDYPIPVFDVDTDLCSRLVVREKAGGLSNIIQPFEGLLPAVPEGKILVIETVTADLFLPEGEEQILPANLLILKNGEIIDAFYNFTMTPIGLAAGIVAFPQTFAASEAVRLYVRAGEELAARSGASPRFDAANGVFAVTISGYFVSEDCPTP